MRRMRLQWDRDHDRIWRLALVDGAYAKALGTLYRRDHDYTVATYDADEIFRYHLPGDLTLDEAKSAAKLLIMAGRQA